LRFTQVPGVAEVASAHAEPAGHVASVQHTIAPLLSPVQWPLTHWSSAVHVVPRPPVVTHEFALQAYPAWQSAVVAQTLLHVAVVSQTYGAHAFVVGVPQLPAPSQ
jgi:hypothetical protein